MCRRQQGRSESNGKGPRGSSTPVPLSPFPFTFPRSLLVHVAARDSGIRTRHVIRLGAQSLRHGCRRWAVSALRAHPPPDQLQILASPLVIGLAVALFVIEFVADKIPYVDSIWDAVHTFIRPPAAALISYGAFAGGVPEEWRVRCCAACGSVALTSHSAKATTRAAANVESGANQQLGAEQRREFFAVLLTWLRRPSAHHGRSGRAARGPGDPPHLASRAILSAGVRPLWTTPQRCRSC